MHRVVHWFICAFTGTPLTMGGYDGSKGNKNIMYLYNNSSNKINNLK